MRSKRRCSLCLQFALILGAGPVLHRPTSLVIHRLEWNLSRILFIYSKDFETLSYKAFIESFLYFNLNFVFNISGGHPDAYLTGRPESILYLRSIVRSYNNFSPMTL